MIRLTRVLRILVVSEIALGVAFIVADLISRRQLPPEVRSFVAATALRSTGSTPLGIGVLVLLGLMIVAWVGLWRMWPRGRALFTAAWVLSLGLVLFMGPYVHSSVAEVLSDLTVAVNGLILGLIYFSDLRHQFGKQLRSSNEPAA